MVARLLLTGCACSARPLTWRRVAAIRRSLLNTIAKILVRELVHQTVSRVIGSVATLTLLIGWLWTLNVLLVVLILILILLLLLLLLLAIVRLVLVVHEITCSACVAIGTLDLRVILTHL